MKKLITYPVKSSVRRHARERYQCYLRSPLGGIADTYGDEFECLSKEYEHVKWMCKVRSGARPALGQQVAS